MDRNHTALGERVARALHLPTGDVRIGRFGQTVADVVVILGQDYAKTLPSH